jgi:hypothetical protein
MIYPPRFFVGLLFWAWLLTAGVNVLPRRIVIAKKSARVALLALGLQAFDAFAR